MIGLGTICNPLIDDIQIAYQTLLTTGQIDGGCFTQNALNGGTALYTQRNNAGQIQADKAAISSGALVVPTGSGYFDVVGGKLLTQQQAAALTPVNTTNVTTTPSATVVPTVLDSVSSFISGTSFGVSNEILLAGVAVVGLFMWSSNGTKHKRGME